MINKKEIKPIIISIILMAIILSVFNSQVVFSVNGGLTILKYLIYSIIIILTSILGKKIIAYKKEIEINHEIWHFQRFGIKKSRHFKTPFPIGVILPLILSVISLGEIKCFTLLQFEAQPKFMRKIRKSKKKTFYELTDWDLGIISFMGILFILLLALISNYFGFLELANYSLFYAIWNVIPFGQLDGMKVLFGSGRLGNEKSNIFIPLYAILIILIILTSVVILI